MKEAKPAGLSLELLARQERAERFSAPIVMAVDVPGKENEWPSMGLVVCHQEIVDGLKREYFPSEFQNIQYEGSRPMGSRFSDVMYSRQHAHFDYWLKRCVGFKGGIVYDRSRPDGTPRKLLDSSRIQGMGWKAATTLEEGLRLYYDWFLSKQDKPRETVMEPAISD